MMYWIKNNGYLSACLAVVLIMLLATGICSLWKIPLDSRILNRPSYEDKQKQIQFYVQDEAGEEAFVSLELSPRHYTEEEARARFQECYEAMKLHVLGNNKSWDQVKDKLNLTVADGYEELNVMIYPAESSYISAEGDILFDQIEGDSYKTFLFLNIAYDSYMESFRLPLTLVKDQDHYRGDAQKILQKLEKDSYEQSYLELPDVINKKHYEYYRKVDSSGIVGICLVIISVCFFLWYRERALVKEEMKRRSEQLAYDYPELISKFLIYMKAGMSVRKTWQKIVEDGQKQQKKYGQRYLYQEMAMTLQEMELGLGEKKAYMKFGKRCGQQAYIRFGSILEQNLRKGSSGIMNLLETERIQALEQRKQEIKAAGEVAGIKLMLPMMVLFGLVMMMIMVPSFMAFGI